MTDFTVINQQTAVEVAGALGRIEKFERDCQFYEAGVYTDTGDAWDLIEHVRGVLRDVAHQVNAMNRPMHHVNAMNRPMHHVNAMNRPMHRAGDPVAIPEKPYHITVLWGENPEAQHEQTYKFRTQAELTAFREGIQEAQGWFDYEITYTDEES
jgi:hypothetical protein